MADHARRPSASPRDAPRARRSPGCRDGWSARRAASGPAPRRGSSPAPPAAARPPRPPPAPAPASSFSPAIAAATRQSSPLGEPLPGEGPEASRSRRSPGPAPCSRRRRPAAGTACPRPATTSPAISFRSVDFPDPFRPTSATRSPGSHRQRGAHEERIAAEAQRKRRQGSGSEARPWRDAPKPARRSRQAEPLAPPLRSRRPRAYPRPRGDRPSPPFSPLVSPPPPHRPSWRPAAGSRASTSPTAARSSTSARPPPSTRRRRSSAPTWPR